MGGFPPIFYGVSVTRGSILQCVGLQRTDFSVMLKICNDWRACCFGISTQSNDGLKNPTKENKNDQAAYPNCRFCPRCNKL
ncbi:hypothetical protein CGT94_13555 [Vibrio metoecus]|nr:hypothetical protein CGT94_13555 [Vibrio metoecus]